MSTDTPAETPLIAGRYRLDRVLGFGGAAVVHEGHDLDTGDRVAVKVYRPDGSGHPTQHHRELRALTSLRHPGLVALLDGGTEPGPDGRTYVVTDLVDGPSLARRLDSGPLGADEVRVLAVGLAEALAHVHANGFVHRDVKPANILLEHGHTPRLADFGIARALDGTVFTATGAVAGTAAYLAPEQVRGETVATAADIYALGLVLIEALTGHLEYPGTLVESALARLHRRPVVPEELPADLAAVLAAMTDLDPAARPSATAVVTALTDPDTVPIALARKRQWFGVAPRVALAAAVVLVALLGGVVLLLGRTAATAPLVPVPSFAAPAAMAPAPSDPTQVVAAPAEPVALPAVAHVAVEAPAEDDGPPAAAPEARGGSPVAEAAAAEKPAAVPAPAPAPVAAPTPAEKPGPAAEDNPAGEDKGKGNDNGNSGKGNSGKGNSGKGNSGKGNGGQNGKGQGSQGGN